MEYIEPEIKENNPKKKYKKIILASLLGAFAVAGIALAYYFTINNIFLDYNNIELFTYSYKYDEDNAGVRIDSIKDDAVLPSSFRIPNKLNNRPVIEIAPEVFKDRTELVSVSFPSSLKTIGEQCFYGCENLESFNIPENLESIGTEAFDNTKWLLDQEDGEVAIGSMLYTYKGEMDYPAYVIASDNAPSTDGTVVDLRKYVNMSSGVFKNQSNLIYVELPESFKEIYPSTFEGCEFLSEVKLHDGLEKIDSNAFYSCLNLSSIDIPESVTYIGDYAFSYCAITGEMTLNSNLDYLGVGAFDSCKQLETVNIPAGFKYISDYLFNGCEKLSIVNFDESEYSSNSKIDYIGAYAFYGTNISEIHVPFNVTSIKQSAFANCKELKNIYLYNNVDGTKKNSYISAFEDEDGSVIEAGWVVEEDIYQGVENIEVGVFKDSPKFDSIILIDSNKTNISNIGEISLPITLKSLGGSNNEASLFTNTSVTTLNLSKDYSGVSNEEYLNKLKNDNSLRILPPSLCESATKLVNVNFGSGSSIETLGRNIFKNCTSLENIVIGNSVKTVETSAFEGCINLKNVTLSTGSKTITESTFAGCSSLKSIVIPDNYLTIGKYVFNGCSSLFEVKMSTNINDIGEGAFANCSALTNISIPDTCKAIASSIFKNCVSLKDITLPSNTNVRSVGNNMFEGDTALVNVTLPNNYQNIGKEAFKSSGLKTLTILYENGVVSLGDNAFENTNIEKILVPSSLVEQYKQNSSWNIYASIISQID